MVGAEDKTAPAEVEAWAVDGRSALVVSASAPTAVTEHPTSAACRVLKQSAPSVDPI
ncbi:MAG: hypothetical protein P8175_07785 [Deltaproteobacteria bacterium]